MPIQPRRSRIVSSRFIVEEIPLPEARAQLPLVPTPEFNSRHPLAPPDRRISRTPRPTQFYRPPPPRVHEDDDEEDEVRGMLEPPRPSIAARVATPFCALLCVGTIYLAFFVPQFRQYADSLMKPLWISPAHHSAAIEALLQEHTRQLAAIETQIFQLARDTVGWRDFASRLSGGKVLPNLTSLGVDSARNPPEFALDEDNRPGLCWLIGGSAGQLGVTLRMPTRISHITVDHIPKELAWDIGTAPNAMTVWGIVDDDASSSAFAGAIAPLEDRPFLHQDRTYVELLRLRYDANQTQSHIQTFPVNPDIWAAEMIFRSVVVGIASNWGSATTCLYRIRVHGEGHIGGAPGSMLPML